MEQRVGVCVWGGGTLFLPFCMMEANSVGALVCGDTGKVVVCGDTGKVVACGDTGKVVVCGDTGKVVVCGDTGKVNIQIQ